METMNRELLTFLANSLWEVPLMAGAACLVSLAMRGSPARHRHAMWIVAMFASLALPLASVDWGRRDMKIPHLVPGAPVITSEAVSGNEPIGGARRAQTRRQPIAALEFGRATALFVAGGYALLLSLLFLRLIFQCLRTARIGRRSEAIELSALVRAVCRRAEIAFGLPNIDVRVSAEIPGPVMAGKTVILPASLAAETSEAVLITAIGHEMAHIARQDFALNLFCEFMWLPLAFHPAALILRRGVARTRELATDEAVICGLVDADVYAESIVAIASEMSGLPRPGFTLGVFDGDILEERVENLIRRPVASIRRARLVLASGLAGLAFCVVVASGLAVSAHAQSAAVPEISLGVDAYNNHDYTAAQTHFQTATDVDPNNVNARLFLVTALLHTIREGMKGPINFGAANVYDPVIRQYDEVLARDPLNRTAIFGLATLGGTRRSQQAHDLLMKLIVSDPNNKDAYYAAAVADWSMVFNPVQVALKEAGFARNTTQVPDAAVRQQLRDKYLPAIEEGYKLLQVAMKLDPEWADPMAYMNLLYRVNAAIVDSPQEFSDFTGKGDSMVESALATQRTHSRAQAQEAPLSVDAAPSRTMLGPFLMQAPPPPPPPPPGAH